MKYKNIIIATVIMVSVAAALYGVAAYKQSHQPLTAVPNVNHADSTAGQDTVKPATVLGPDPCGGTGGTGQIVSVGNNTITIKRHDGVNETIKLTDKTTIRNSVASLSISDLKAGDRVTVVVMSHHTATTVLVCNGQGSKPVK